MRKRWLSTVILATSIAVAMGRADFVTSAQQPATADDQWPAYGGDAGGTRYSPLTHVTAENVGRLELAWTYRTGELGQEARDGRELTFEATPVHFDGRLYLSTAFGKVIALNPQDGRQIWTFDPEIDRSRSYSEVTSRGVSTWRDSQAGADATCARRIFYGTIDARVISLDAVTGQRCATFGTQGEIDLAATLGIREKGDYQVTSPPAILGDLVIVGSSIGDNWSANTGSGVVRAFDARTGTERWSWHPLGTDGKGPVGAANAWSLISVDRERDLVFVPTTSPSPDFFGGLRPGNNADANSLVALRGTTGERVWGFQTIHHDLWDYDLAAQPSLVTIRKEGQALSAVVQATKMGSLFVLDRERGTPLFPVEERPVPQTDIPGEASWPTQPFPVLPRSLMPQGPMTPDSVWGATDADRAECRELVSRYHSRGIFTPPTLQGTIMVPGNGAGTNWGSVAYDPVRQLLILNMSRVATLVQLIPAADVERLRAESRKAGEDYEYATQRGAPFGMRRRTLETAKGVPCTAPPWGTLAAVDLVSGDVRWEVPFGQGPDEHPLTKILGSEQIGVLNAGGPLVTASGLVFIAATLDKRFRAFDVETGRILWTTTLPRAGLATPMTYRAVDGRQMIVIAAGGHGKWGLEVGDYLMAFALPQTGR